MGAEYIFMKAFKTDNIISIISGELFGKESSNHGSILKTPTTVDQRT